MSQPYTSHPPETAQKVPWRGGGGGRRRGHRVLGAALQVRGADPGISKTLKMVRVPDFLCRKNYGILGENKGGV